MRIDKFLWSVRLFKTRSVASEHIRNGKVEVDGSKVKASREVKAGDRIAISRGTWQSTCEVLSLPKNRIGPKLVEDYIVDITAPEEREKEAEVRAFMQQQPKGLGRPSKRDRRKLDAFNG